MSDFRPEVFGKYILLEKIATGGMAEVYLAKAVGAENVSKFFALKRILPQFSQNYEFVEMFKEEAKIAVQLSHANIVPIFEFGEERSQFYLAMEFVDGKNLRQVLNYFKKREAILNIPMAVYIIKEAARGLDHAHRAVDGMTGAPLNIVHRDISPQNLMLSYEGEVKIVDFGIAKAESKIETTRAGTLKGKFGYMSPEQSEGQEVDYRTDIFSLGIVLWELLANDRLFVANNEMNTLRKIRDCQIPSLRKIDPNIPQELERISNKALTRDRSLRYQSSDELSKDLNLFLNKYFPEFAVQDFSKLLKKVFQKERDETRQKFIEYTKLKLRMESDDKTNIVKEVTNTQTEPSMPSNTSQTSPSDPSLPSFTDSKNITSSNSFNAKLTKTKPPEKLNLDFDRQDLIVKSQKQRVKLKTRSQTQTNYTTYQDPYPQLPHQSTQHTYTSTETEFKPDPPSRFLTLLVILGFCYLGYKFYHSEYYGQALTTYYNVMNIEKDEDAKQLGSKSTQKTKTPEVAPAPQTPYYSLIITSEPTGAAIFIDDRSSEVFTPGQVRVPANTDFKLVVKKDGYAPFSKVHRVAKPGEEYKATLSPLQSGFLKIQVIGGTGTVYVNNVQVLSNDLLKRYPVFTGSPVQIQVRGTDGTVTEETVQPLPNVVTNIVIKLEKKRKPASQKKLK